MTPEIPDAQLSQLGDFVSGRMGLCFPRERWSELENGIRSAAPEFGFTDPSSCIQWLVNSHLTKDQIEVLASHFTVGETYFFREKKSFEALEEHILPELVGIRRKGEKYLRIWSAACSTGEEPYSIAILLNKIIPDLKDWNITILATDINPRFLQKAKEGIYSDWSFRDAPAWIKRYFKKAKNGFEILPDIRKMVTFSYHNLAEDSYPSLLNNTNAMDVIFCRNVLMYFSHERARAVLQNLNLCLMEGGWLVLGMVETSHFPCSKFAPVNFQDAVLFKKDMSDVSKHAEKIVRRMPDLASLPHKSFRRESKSAASPPVEKIYEDACALYEQGKYAEAALHISGLVSLNRKNSNAIILLARAYANQGRLSEALEWCEKAIATDSLNPGSYYLRAMILQERGELGEAARSLRRTLYLDQNFVLAHFSLGNLSKQQGRLKESDRYFKNALTLLKRFGQDEILPESEKITAGRLSEIIITLMDAEKSPASSDSPKEGGN